MTTTKSPVRLDGIFKFVDAPHGQIAGRRHDTLLVRILLERPWPILFVVANDFVVRVRVVVPAFESRTSVAAGVAEGEFELRPVRIRGDRELEGVQFVIRAPHDGNEGRPDVRETLPAVRGESQADGGRARPLLDFDRPSDHPARSGADARQGHPETLHSVVQAQEVRMWFFEVEQL